MITQGKIIKSTDTEKGSMVSLFTLDSVTSSIKRYSNQGSAVNAELRIDDGRTITAVQRRKIYATIKDIAMFTGDVPEWLKEFLKYEFCEETDIPYFSLSNCSLSTARDFITHLLDFALEWDIPLSDTGLNRTEDIDRYLYSCIKYRRCCITGKKNADIHHVTGSRVGMGRNRNQISHNNLCLMALSREWHNRVHQEGEEKIFADYKIYGIKVDKETLQDLGLRAEDIS